MSLDRSHEQHEESGLREAISNIEAINTGSEQRAQIIMVLLGLKPAAGLKLYPWNSSPKESESLLDRTSLKYLKRESNSLDNTVAEYAVSKDEQTAQRLLDCDSSSEFGALMGYPETAIRAFETKDTYDGPLPEDIAGSVFRMIFSREHHEEEFETIRKWNRALLEYAPELASR